ncbi:MAG: c-type cytochrome [Caldilineaceae bacterium]|nr:c-type cytochrome [Caldilineaceae bacterium]
MPSLAWLKIIAGNLPTNRLLMSACAAIVCGLVLGAGQVVAQAPPPPYVPEEVPAPASKPSALLGATLYQQNCAPCHGQQGAGDGPQAATLDVSPKRLDDAVAMREIAPAAAFHQAKYGSESGAMPAFSIFLNDEQIWQALAYAWSLHTSEEIVTAGSELYAESCAACHGATGQGDGPDAEEQLGDFTDAKAMNVRSLRELDDGWRAAHAEIGADLNEDDRWAVLDAVRSFTYLPPWQSPFEPGAGVIDGQIVQGTAGADPLAPQEVSLMAYMSFTPVATFTTTTSADGGFAFEELSTDPGIVYFLGTRYGGISYGTDLISLSEISPTLTLEIPVYETSSDDSGIRLTRVNWLVDHAPGQLRVRQIIGVANDLDTTVTGHLVDGSDAPVTLALPVPANATDVEFQDGALGGRYQQADDVIYDTTPIRPGQQSRQVLVGYTVPYTGAASALLADFAYPVESLNVLVADLPGLEVSAAAPLEDVGNQTVQGNPYRVWTGELAGAQPVEVTLANLIPAGETDPRDEPAIATPFVAPAPEPPPATISPIFAALGIGALVLIVGGGILYWKYSRDRRSTKKLVADQRERLLTEIAALDDRHDAGDLDDETWSAERVVLMNNLRTVTAEMERLETKRGAGNRG